MSELFRLIQDLRSDRPEVRAAAAARLVAIGPDAILPLCGAVAGAPIDLRVLDSAEFWVRQLGSPNDPTRAEAEWRLVQMDEKAVGPLSEALANGNVSHRARIARVLNQIGRPARLECRAAVRLFLDKSPDVRQVAAAALVRHGGEGVPDLCKALRDENAYVRHSAALALGKIGDPRAVPDLCELVRKGGEVSGPAAAEALGRIGDETAIPALCQALSGGDAGTIQASASALGEIAEKRPTLALRQAIQPLRKQLGPFAGAFREPQVAAACRWALSRIEAAIGASKDLPLPSETPPSVSTKLPRPALPPQHQHLPRVDPALDEGA